MAFGAGTCLAHCPCRRPLPRGLAVPGQEDALARLRNGEPLQYLLGEWEFYGLTLAVGPGVLIPRADTETVVDACLERLTPPLAR